MRKAAPSSLLLAFLVVASSPSTALAKTPAAPQLKHIASLTPPSALSFGPWTIKVTPQRMVVLGTHVSSRTIAAYDRRTWKLAWRYPGKVEAFVLCGKLVVVSDLKQRVVGLDLATGKKRWTVAGYYLAPYQRRTLHPNSRTRDRKLLLTGGGKHALVDVRTGRIVLRAPKILAIPRYRRGTIGLQGYTYRLPAKKPLASKGTRLLALLQLETPRGKIEGIYAWSLTGRRFALSQHGHDAQLKELARVQWTMPKLAGSGAESGAPEPEKLATEVGLIGDQLLLYENYVNYRWSWGRGVNRLTGLSMPQASIAFQLWGQQKIGKAAPAYRGFVLRPGSVFVTTGSTLHWQQPMASLGRLRLDRPLKPARGLVGASHLLPLGKCHLLSLLTAGKRVCLHYDRRQVAPKRYRTAIELRLLTGDKLSASVRQDFAGWDPDAFHTDGGLVIIPSLLAKDRKRCRIEVFSLRR